MAQEYQKWSARGSQTEPRRVQNGVPEGPERHPMAQDVGQRGAQCHPKGLREFLVPLGARQVDIFGPGAFFDQFGIPEKHIFARE